jgi:hypothetical protein
MRDHKRLQNNTRECYFSRGDVLRLGGPDVLQRINAQGHARRRRHYAQPGRLAQIPRGRAFPVMKMKKLMYIVVISEKYDCTLC